MAQRRMTSLEVIDTDAFLDMPVSSQLLYFHLNARADDDGFVANPKKVTRMLNAGDDDLKLLIVKKFLIAFSDGVCVIKHWRINNFVRKDIYKETKYLDHKNTLFIRSNGAYTQSEDGRAIPLPRGHFTLESVDDTLTQRQPRLGKGSIGKNTETKVSFPLEGKSITTDEDYEIVSDTPQKEKKERKDKGALALREKLYNLFEKEFDVRPTPHVADYLRILDAMKRLNEKQILELVEDGIDSGKKKTVRESLTAREVDIYLQNN